MTSSMASWTSGLWKFRSGCSGRKLCRKYCRRRASHVQAGPPKTEAQLLGGIPSCLGSAQTYQSAFGPWRDRRLCANQGWRSEGVGQHLVDDDLEPQLAGVREQGVEVGERAEQGVHIAVVRHVVAHVRHGRGEERGQPDRVGAELGHVAQAGGDARQVSHPVAVGVLKAARIDLIDHRAAPPIAHAPIPRSWRAGRAGV